MKVNIAYSFDDNYAQHAGCSLISLLEKASSDIEKKTIQTKHLLFANIYRNFVYLVLV